MSYSAPQGGTPRRIKELRPDEVHDVLMRDGRLIVPVGTCAQHGRHLPLGTDTLIVEHLADDFSAEFGILRAPTMEYGVNAVSEKAVAGNTSLRKKTLHQMLNDLINGWESSGVTEFILLTAHEYDPHQEALATVYTTKARVRVVDIFAVDIREFLEGQSEPMHGDEVDTSLMLFLAPHLVRMDLAEDYMMSREELRRYRRGWLKIPEGSSGSIGRPSLATSAKGAAIYGHIREKLRNRVFVAPGPAEIEHDGAA